MNRQTSAIVMFIRKKSYDDDDKINMQSCISLVFSILAGKDIKIRTLKAYYNSSP